MLRGRYKLGLLPVNSSSVRTSSMKSLIQSFAISVSLLVLGLGFSAIGFAPFLTGNHHYSGDGPLPFVGSGFSILIGMAFFSAAICFIWARFKSDFLDG